MLKYYPVISQWHTARRAAAAKSARTTQTPLCVLRPDALSLGKTFELFYLTFIVLLVAPPLPPCWPNGPTTNSKTAILLSLDDSFRALPPVKCDDRHDKLRRKKIYAGKYKCETELTAISVLVALDYE